MLTRGDITHQYRAVQGERVTHAGVIKVNVVKNVPQTWAITRPCSYPNPNGSPFYCHTDGPNNLARGGALSLSPARPHLQMDPSDSATWQRPYRFTALEG